MNAYKCSYIGRVQGVGFRYTIMRYAKQHSILGWVRNMPDGSVFAYVQGEESDLSMYFRNLELYFKANIREKKIVETSLNLTFKGFHIKY